MYINWNKTLTIPRSLPRNTSRKTLPDHVLFLRTHVVDSRAREFFACFASSCINALLHNYYLFCFMITTCFASSYIPALLCLIIYSCFALLYACFALLYSCFSLLHHYCVLCFIGFTYINIWSVFFVFQAQQWIITERSRTAAKLYRNQT